MKYLLLTISLFILAICASAQERLKGNVIDKDSGEPIPFPTISLDNGSVWALGNSKGEFSILIPMNSTMIHFSSLGYMNQAVPLKDIDISKVLTVSMQEDVTVLPEIVVIPGDLDSKTIGMGELPERTMRFTHGEMNYYAVAIPFKIRPRPSLLESAGIYIAANNGIDYTLRCRIMKRGKGGKPGDDLLFENVIQVSGQENDWVEFDLGKYDIWLEEKNIFLVIEVLRDGIITEGVKNGIAAPSFATISGQGRSYFAVAPGIWVPHQNMIVSNIKIAYLD